MSGTPTVLCVIPTHGRDESLARALRSVLGQTLAPVGVVVVDDLGSPATREVVESMSGRHGTVQYVDASTRPVKSAAASRNLGVERGGPSDFVAFLDDDDRWEPLFLQRCLDRALETGVDLVTAWGALESGGVRYEHAWHPGAGCRAQDVLAANPGITGSNFVVRRPVFDMIGGFDSGQWVFNDLEFLVRFLDSGAAYDVVEEDLVVQTADVGEHLSSRSDRRAAGIQRYIQLHRERLNRQQLRALRRQAAVARMHPRRSRLGRLASLTVALYNSSPRDALRAVATRLRRDPSYG